MSADYNERYIFEAEWYDKVACILKKFYLYYYPADDSVELFDLKSRKTFLRRTKCEGIQAKDFYVGGMVTIFSRCIKITDYADCNTKQKLQTKMQKTFALLKPDIIEKMGEIFKWIVTNNFHISNLKMVRLTQEQAEEFCQAEDASDIPHILTHLTSGPVVALELLGENGVARWQELVGPNDSAEARRKASSSPRASLTDKILNAVYGSSDQEVAERELNLVFGDSKSKKSFQNTATLHDCTCCIIKPHAVQARLSGHIIDDIQKAGYNVSAIQQFYVDPVNAEEFLEVYKGVLPDYGAMVAELQSGPCIVMEITRKGEHSQSDIHAEFRKLCGPMDPDIARQVRPDTLRAKYGKTKVQNAVHCSDLLEDGILEVEYFFKILDEA